MAVTVAVSDVDRVAQLWTCCHRVADVALITTLAQYKHTTGEMILLFNFKLFLRKTN